MGKEVWIVELEAHGRRWSKTVTIEPPFGIRKGDAEVKAIRESEAEDASLRGEARALSSSLLLREDDAPLVATLERQMG